MTTAEFSLSFSHPGKKDQQGDEEPQPASFIDESEAQFSSEVEREQWETEQEQLDR